MKPVFQFQKFVFLRSVAYFMRQFWHFVCRWQHHADAKPLGRSRRAGYGDVSVVAGRLVEWIAGYDTIKFVCEREKEVVELLTGQSNKQIALALGVSQSTVEYHLKNVYKKLQVSSERKQFCDWKSMGDNASGELGKSTVEMDGEPADNGETISIRRIL